jgi:hypothetical protein
MARRRFLTGSVANPVDAFRFAPLEPECEVVQFERPLSALELHKAAAIMRGRPDVELYVYGHASRDLDFLRYFEELRRLSLPLYELEDIPGISQLGGRLKELIFGETRRSFSLRFLESLPHLSKLFLVGHRTDIATIQSLQGLSSLGLSKITLSDLRVIEPLAQLRDLSIFLGGTRNLLSLSRLQKLESLFLVRITKMSNLSVLGELESVKTLRLDWMRNVTSLPSFSRLSRLEILELNTMKGLTDLSPIAAAPALRRLRISAMPKLDARASAASSAIPASKNFTPIRESTRQMRRSNACFR